MLSATLPRRTALRLLLGGATITAVASCAPQIPSTGGTAPSNPPGGASPQPKVGGTLRLGRSIENSNIDGHAISPANYVTIWSVYDRLIEYDASLKPQPRLAESWDLSSDYTQLKFNLRKGVQFHNGRELTSEDVRWNIARVRDPKVGASQLATMSSWLSRVEAPDKYTVIVGSDAPRTNILDFFEYLNIVDRDTMEGPDAKNKAVGTGPFMWADFQPGSMLRLRKNKNYWVSGRPYVDEVVSTITGDPQSLVTQFEAGQVDIVDALPIRDAQRLKSDPRYTVLFDSSGGYFYQLVCNVGVAPGNNKQFRQALNYAVDRKRFVDLAYAGQAEPRDLPWPPNSPAYDAAQTSARSFDLDHAKTLIQSSGIANPSFEFLYAATDAAGALLGQVLQADLQKIGVAVVLKPAEGAAGLQAQTSRNYQVTASISTFAQVQPSTTLSLGRFSNPTSNAAGWMDAAYAQLVQSAAAEVDATKRRQVYHQLNELLLDESVIIALSNAPSATGARGNVRGLSYTLSGAVVLADLSLG
jgi:peptide/nickel transport system substrate-binding protein